MAAGTVLEKYATSFEILTTGKSFADLNDALGKDPVGTSVVSDFAQFSTDQILFYFNSSEIRAFLDTDPIIAYASLSVQYKVYNDTSDEYTVTVQGTAYQLSEPVLNRAQTNNVVWTKINEDGGDPLTAYFTFYLGDLLSTSTLSDDTFGISVQFFCQNASESNVTIEIYEVGLTLKSSTGASYILFYDEYSQSIPSELVLGGADLFDYNIIQYQTARNSTIRVYNVGSEDLTIEANGITLADDTDIKFDGIPITAKQVLTTNAYLAVPIVANGFTADKNVYTSLRVVSDDYSAATRQLFFNYVVGVASAARIQVSYDGKVYANNSIINLASLPLNIDVKTTVGLKNIGDSALAINSTSLSGNGTISQDSIVNNSTISVGQTKYFKFYNDTDSVGNKSVIVNVKSNDSTNSDVYIQFVYSVAEQSKITFTEGASASATQTERTLDELVDFGFVDKGRNIKKYYNISNTGIYKNLIINSINSTVSDINVGSLPSLPYTLQKNATNTLSFEVEFLTSTSGLKEGSLIIDYTEGTADAPATPVKPNNAVSIALPSEEF